MSNNIYDAVTGLAFLISQLTHVEAKVFKVKYKDITYPNLVPVSNEAGEFATSVTYFFMDGRIVAKFMGTNALDVPISEIGTNKAVVPVELGGVGYQYSDEELRQALHLKQSLPALKAQVARRGFEELAQRVATLGDSQYNLPGMLNNINVTIVIVVDPGSGTEWINKTPDQILFDINSLMGGIFVDTLQVERPTRLLLPTSNWNLISGTPRSSTSDTTILQWLIQNSPYLQSESDVVPVSELEGLGTGSTGRMIAYDKSIEKLVFHMPMPIRFLQPERRGVGFQVPAQFKISGVEVRYPGSMRFGDGI